MRNGFISKKQILAAFFVIQLLCLSGCSDLRRPEEVKKDNQKIKYLKSCSDLFKSQAKAQYGQDAKVKKIHVDVYKSHSGYGTYKTIVADMLYGVITANGETFDAAFDVYGTRQILTTKNYELIEESLKDFFGYLNLDIVAADVTTFEFKREYLPDDVLSYEDMLKSEIHTNVYIYVTNELENITASDFDGLKVHWELYKHSICGLVFFIQVNEKKLDEVSKYKFRNKKIILDNTYKNYICVSCIGEFYFEYTHS